MTVCAVVADSQQKLTRDVQYNAELDAMEVDEIEMRKLQRYEREIIDNNISKIQVFASVSNCLLIFFSQTHFNETEMAIALRKHVIATIAEENIDALVSYSLYVLLDASLIEHRRRVRALRVPTS